MAKVLKSGSKIETKFRKLEQYMDELGIIIYRHYQGFILYDAESNTEFLYCDAENFGDDLPQEFPYFLETKFKVVSE